MELFGAAKAIAVSQLLLNECSPAVLQTGGGNFCAQKTEIGALIVSTTSQQPQIQRKSFYQRLRRAAWNWLKVTGFFFVYGGLFLIIVAAVWLGSVPHAIILFLILTTIATACMRLG